MLSDAEAGAAADGEREEEAWTAAVAGKDMFVGCRRCLAGSCVHANRKDTQGTHLDNAHRQRDEERDREREREIGRGNCYVMSARHAGNEKPQSQRSSTGSIRQATEREREEDW